jgi:predicted membrane protein
MGNNKRRISGSLLIGLLLIVLGALWVLNNTNVIDFEIREWWPLILIAIGVVHLFKRRRFFDFAGWLFIGLGVVFLLVENGVLHWHEVWRYWPVILILVGLSIVFQGVKFKKHREHDYGKDEDYDPDEAPSSDEERIHESCLFGGWSKRVTAKNFSGGNISAVFGGVEIDLREAKLSEKGGVLDISAVFGGVELYIPDSWVIEDRSSAIFAGIDYKCSNTRGSTGKRLIINASAMFGGVDIKN